MSALNARFLFGAVGLGLLVASAHCFIDAQSALVGATVLYQTALLGAIFGLALLAVALCCDHRTDSEKRTAQRHARALQRERNRCELDRLRNRNRSRNRF